MTKIVIGAGNRLDVAHDIDRAFFIERHVDGMRRSDLQKRISIRWRARGRLQGEIAAGTRPIVDDHRLPEPLRQRLTDEARDDVGRATGGTKTSTVTGRVG